MISTTTGGAGGRPLVMSARGVVTSGHYLATQVGLSILARGGNAMDAAAGTAFALALLCPDQNGICGECPTLFFDAKKKKVLALSGHGTAPKQATIQWFREHEVSLIPGDGFLPAIVPPAIASWIHLLRNYGTLRLRDVLTPAIEIAREGYPMYTHVRSTISWMANRFRNEWPSSAEVFMPGGKLPADGTLLKQPHWANTFELLVKAERRYRSRDAGLKAAYDVFYLGPIAERIVNFCRNNSFRDASGKAHSGLLTVEDFAKYTPEFEEPQAVSYRGARVYKCGTWTQGPVMLQALAILEHFDLEKMGHNSSEYIHTVIEALKLAFADREFYYGDPKFSKIPMRKLLSKAYARERAALVGEKATHELRPGGYPPITAKDVNSVNQRFGLSSGPENGDTTKLDVIDRAGNMVSATVSGGWMQSSPVIPGLGFPLGTRGQMFSLVEGHPNALAPEKRPRTTLTPTVAFRAGKPWMAFGSPGGEQQDQWALQFFLNVMHFDMMLQEAIEAPTVWTNHAPNSFYPRKAQPGSLYAERRIAAKTLRGLKARGHKVTLSAEWSGGNTLAAAVDQRTGVRFAAASPRMEPAYAGGL